MVFFHKRYLGRLDQMGNKTAIMGYEDSFCDFGNTILKAPLLSFQ